MVVAGVAGTAITADLGARKIREELDALQVLGVDPIKNLVVPRVLALMVATALLDIFALVFGIAGGIITMLLYNQPLGGFIATLFSNASITDLWGSVLMCSIFGATIAVVCAYKGMSASGGAAGVGRAVNQAVVISFADDRGDQLRLHRDPARDEPRTAEHPLMGRAGGTMARGAAGVARELRRDHPLRGARRRHGLLGPGSPLLRREACARPGS